LIFATPRGIVAASTAISPIRVIGAIGRILAAITPVGIIYGIGIILISTEIAQVFAGLAVDETQRISLRKYLPPKVQVAQG
jgi:hypothetical protein